MPWSDFSIVFHWWTVLFLFGAVAFPLTKKLFSQWFDQGYVFSKAISLALVTWLVYVMGTVRIVPFSHLSIVISLLAVFLLGIVFSIRFSMYDLRFKNVKQIVLEEFFFFGALLFWAWVKGHEPSIRGLEKFMDYGFMKSILESAYFPPPDMWYAGNQINYYYFGHMVVAVLTKLSGIDLAYTFNLMLATIFAFTLTMSFSIGIQISRIGKIGRIGQLGAGLLTAFLVTLAGNMQTLYAFTRGYTGDNVKPFWELLWPIGQFLQKLPEGLNTYWYANATRFIPFTIHEFPSYSFVVSDVHGHVLSLPFALLAIALLITLFSHGQSLARYIFYGFLVGVLLMTNALDGPIYFALLGVVAFVGNWKRKWMMLLIVFVVAGLSSLPFLSHFKSFVNGLAVNCPPEFFANTKIGPLLFEGVEKCQRSPLWMMALLWEFFLYCGGWLMFGKKREKLLLVFFLFSVALIIFPEFFYFKDIYPAHFRSNTMFKLGYQAFILFSLVSGYAIVRFARKKLFLVFLVPQLFLVSIYPIFSVRSYFNSLRNYEGLYGLNWLSREYPDDYTAINWLNVQSDRAALVEADGDSYTDYNHVSAFTGNPTIVGWAVHEWLWRGGYDVVAPRREEVRTIYESRNATEVRTILEKYNVRYIIVGNLERQKFGSLNEDTFSIIGKPVFTYNTTVIYKVGY